MSTATAPTDITEARQLRLPRMGRFQVPKVRYSFAGALVETISSQEDLELFQAISEGATGTIILSVDGLDREITLGWECTDWGGGKIKEDGAEKAVARRKITINGRDDGDDEGED